MVHYINPPDCSKEEWLRQFGKELQQAPPFGMPGHLPVCLMDNGPFTAAGICYSEAELRAFNDPHDYRPKIWYLVPMEDLIKVCPSVAVCLTQPR